MRRQLDEMALLLKKHNISIPASARNDDLDEEEEDKEYQRKGHLFLLWKGLSFRKLMYEKTT